MVGASEIASRLRAVLQEASAAAADWDRQELATWVCAQPELRALFDALTIDTIAAADVEGVATLEPGCRTLPQFIDVRTNGRCNDVGADLGLARFLRHYPSLAEALRDGRITRRHVTAIKGVETPTVAPRLRARQAELAETAATMGWQAFQDACAKVAVWDDVDGSACAERSARRGVTITTHKDGTVAGSWLFDAVTGAAFKAALHCEARRLEDIDADASNPDARDRTAKQRMADALAGLVAKSVLRPDGTVGAPLVQVVAGQGVLEETMCRAAAAAAGVAPVGPDGRPLGDDLRIDPTDPTRRCELSDGTPLHPSQVAGLLGVATLRRVVLGAASELLDLGREVRWFPRHLREGMITAGRGRCATPGCDAPLRWLEADHIIPWRRGGPTSVANGQIICAACNKAKGDRLASPPDASGGRACAA